MTKNKEKIFIKKNEIKHTISSSTNSFGRKVILITEIVSEYMSFWNVFKFFSRLAFFLV